MILDLEKIHVQVAAVLTSAWHKYSGPDGLSWLILFGTILLSAVITYKQQRNIMRPAGGFIRYAFPPSQLRHPSARADLLLWIMRRFTSPLLVAPMAITAATTGYAVYAALSHITGLSHHTTTGINPALMVLFTLTMLLAYDLSYYIYHYLRRLYTSVTYGEA